MDYKFLVERIKTIANYQKRFIDTNTEKNYYLAYTNKLANKLQFYVVRNYSLHGIIDDFEWVESFRVKNGWLYKPYQMLQLACTDVRDVVNSQLKCDGEQDLYTDQRLVGLKINNY